MGTRPPGFELGGLVSLIAHGRHEEAAALAAEALAAAEPGGEEAGEVPVDPLQCSPSQSSRVCSPRIVQAAGEKRRANSATRAGSSIRSSMPAAAPAFGRSRYLSPAAGVPPTSIAIPLTRKGSAAVPDPLIGTAARVSEFSSDQAAPS